MQVHSDDMVASSHAEHVRHQLGCDWSPRLVLLVHPRIRETWDHSGDPPGRCPPAGGSENEKFHEVIVNVVGSRLYDEDVFVSNGLGYFDVDLPI